MGTPIYLSQMKVFSMHCSRNFLWFQGSVKWGPTPKTVVAVVVGYFIGKLSYQNKCAEKIMAIPGSKLGEMLRMKRKGGLYEK